MRCSFSRPAALLVATGCALSVTLAPQLATAAQPSSRDAAARSTEADLPIRDITLYRSGVGFFQRSGQVSGDATVTMRFDAEQVNDILKSLVLLDLDGGGIDAVRYASDEPVARRLQGFGIDISRVGSIVDLLSQLRGTSVSISSTEGSFTGTVLAIEDRMTVITTDGAVGHFKEPYVSLVTEAGVRAVAVSRISSLEIGDEQLASELAKALAVIADTRREQTKTVELAFTGENRPRRVIASYVHETPVWKTSYRLVVPEDESGSLTLQGWAIVENTTDEDWQDVRLSLASGRPVSFTMDLYETLYMARPEVPVPVELGVRPQTYASGQQAREKAAEQQAMLERRSGRGGGQSPFSDELSSLDSSDDFRLGYMDVPGLDMNYVLGQAQATGGDVGEQFIYTVDMPVTIERQRSAMLPIIMGAVDGRRVSIYSPMGGGSRVMRGIEFTNTSGSHLLPGPISVISANTYAGDAQIDHTAREQERLLSYAVDLDMQVSHRPQSTEIIESVHIVDGTMIYTRRFERVINYEWSNNDASNGRDLLIEHPRSGGWDLVEPNAPTDTTDSSYRFELKLEPASSGMFTVTEGRTGTQSIALVDADIEALVRYQRRGRGVSQAVIDAATRARELQAEVFAAERELRRLRGELNDITSGQRRIRENMDAIDRNSELYKRYLDTLSQQEDRIEEIRQHIEDWNAEFEARQSKLESFLRNLDVR